MKRLLLVTLLLLVLGGGSFFIQNSNLQMNANAANMRKVFAQELININTATLEELDTLPGIGPVKAQAIIDYRDANGPFAIIEDIMNVSGIGQATFDNIKDFITVEESEPEPEPEPPPDTGGGGTPPAPVPIYSDRIIINEIMINPEDSDADWEFIELYNKDGAEADLSGWILEDTMGRTRRYVIPNGTKIPGQGYLFFNSFETRIVLNNSGDGVRLSWPDEGAASATPEDSGPANEEEAFAFDGREWVWTEIPTPGEENEIALDVFLVTKVIDGDTIEIETGERVRYIGIDTPEPGQSECFSSEATRENEKMVLGKRVRMEKDRSDVDRYERLLRYVYVDDVFINEHLVKNGFGYASAYPPDTKFQNELTEAENWARKNRKGLWKECYKDEVIPVREIYSGGIIINEIMPNPKGDDRAKLDYSQAELGGEWIELKNLGDKDVSLEGWQMSDMTRATYVIKDEDFDTMIIKAGGYFLIKREISGIALNNAKDRAELLWPDGGMVDDKEFEGAKEGVSWARDESSDEWFWTMTMTPGEENEILKENKTPEAKIEVIGPPVGEAGELGALEEIFFDGSESSDPEGDELDFLWTIKNIRSGRIIFSDFSGIPSFDYVFRNGGDYEIGLKVFDKEGVSGEAVLELDVAPLRQGSGGSPLRSEGYSIFITEVLPNPEGGDTEGEFIEVYNGGEVSANLSGWQIDDMEGGSRPYIIADIAVEAGEYFVFWRSETGLALNNNWDEVRLFDSGGEIADEVGYDEVSEGMSYALRDPSTSSGPPLRSGDWDWTNKVTAGLENEFGPASAKASADRPAGKIGGSVITTTLEEIKNLSNGNMVRVQGTIAVEPGVLGSQIFYIVGSPGIQVYSYYKDFPELACGDRVEVSGEISEAQGEKRIKTKSRADIKVVEHGEEPEAEYSEIGEIGEIGSLVVIEGELIEKSGSSYYVDDGTGEIRVYFKSSANIKKPSVKERDILVISGIVSMVGGEIALLPRYDDDVRKTMVTGIAMEDLDNGERVIKIPEGGFEWERYMWVLNGALVLVVGGVIWRRRR